jgi:hypothetical protein
MPALLMDKDRELNSFEVMLKGDNLLFELERVMYCDDFDDESKVSEILGEMPDMEGFQKECRRGRLRVSSDVPAELASLYGQGVLSREQEHHEFRKYNFLKYMAIKAFS